MQKKLSSILQYLIFLGLGAFLLWYSASNLSEENKTQLVKSLKEADYLMVIPPMLALLVSHYIRALRWRLLIAPLGQKPGIANTFFATMLGYFFNLLFPRLGEVMKCTMLAKYENIPADKLIGTMVAERVCDFICLLIIIFITVAIQFDLINQFASVQLRGILYDEAGHLKLYKLLVLAIVFLIIGLGLRWIFKRYAEVKAIQKIKKITSGIWQGLTSIRHLKQRGLFLLYTILIWFLYLCSAKLGFYTMAAVAHLSWDACFSIITFGSFAMLATQGGIGAYQLVIQKLLPLYGISEGEALGFGWILWIAQTGIVIFAGIICLVLIPVINRNRTKNEIPAVNKK